MRVLNTSHLTSTPKSSTIPRPNLTSGQRVLKAKRNNHLATFEQQEAKRRRRKPGTVALKQIKYYQSTTTNLIQALPFQRIVREIADSFNSDPNNAYKFQEQALIVLQTAVEAYMVGLFADVNLAAIHAKRVTIKPEDLHFVRKIRGNVNVNERF